MPARYMGAVGGLLGTALVYKAASTVIDTVGKKTKKRKRKRR
jgi:hypothetical protein